MHNSPSYLLNKLVFTLNRTADAMLRTEFNITYKRALFLIVLHGQGPLSQHELAVALGYTDPAISSMLAELAKEGYITITPSPQHGRKRIASLTPKGERLTIQVRHFLDGQFAKLMEAADIDVQEYIELTEQIYNALTSKKEEA